MKVLRSVTLMRHAKSDWSNNRLADHDRPLNERGRRAASLMGRWIENRPIPVQVVLVSTALRTQQTLELIRGVWKELRPEVFSTQNLYLASPQGIVQQIQQLDNAWQSVLVLGHNPGIGELASLWAQTPMHFPTGCLASFSVEAENWAQISLEPVLPTQISAVCKPRDMED